jgi:hypothetical protein
MPGLVPGIHVFLGIATKQDVDGRDISEKTRFALSPGHDATRILYTRVISNCAFWPVP